MRPEAVFSDLKGKKFTEIIGLEKGSEEVIFKCDDGQEFRLVYHQDCCASCSIEDVAGDVTDLIGPKVLFAEEVSSNEPDEVEISERKAKWEKEKATHGEYFYDSDYGPNPRNGWKSESETWCFYKLATVMGSVTIRWYGSSNGYYSESATFEAKCPEHGFARWCC